MENSYITVQRLTRNYVNPVNGRKFQALSGIDLRVYKGDFITIFGPSGAGKTTFLNIIGGNIRPSTGTIIVDDIEVQALAPLDLDRYRRHMIGFLWQDSSENLIHGLTVDENLKQVMAIAGYPRQQREKRIVELLTNFEMLDRRYHKVNLLSGGEALRASLAVALANDPKLLIADEPTAELDHVTSQVIIDFLRKINRELGVTVIVASHDSLFESVADLNYYISDGTIVGMKVKGTNIEKGNRVVLLNALGQIQIPPDMRQKYGLEEFVEIGEYKDEGLFLRQLKFTNNREQAED